MSADNHCLPGPYFHFTIPVAHRASGYSGADQPVVSRQSMFARVKIPFHDTCSSSGQRATLVQISPLSADNRSQSAERVPFHDTDNAVVSGAEVQITPLSADNRSQSAARVSFHDTYSGSALGHTGADHLVVSRQSLSARVRILFHDTCSSSGQRALWCRSARCQPTITACQGQNSISRYR